MTTIQVWYTLCEKCNKHKRNEFRNEETEKDTSAKNAYCDCVEEKKDKQQLGGLEAFNRMTQHMHNKSWICSKCDASINPDISICPNCSYSKKLIDYNNPYGFDQVNPYGLAFTDEQLTIKTPEKHHCVIHDVDYYGNICLQCEIKYNNI